AEVHVVQRVEKEGEHGEHLQRDGHPAECDPAHLPRRVDEVEERPGHLARERGDRSQCAHGWHSPSPWSSVAALGFSRATAAHEGIAAFEKAEGSKCPPSLIT